jgi:ATP-dependent RNA circularization protein (DNA/RNA ligase family)
MKHDFFKFPSTPHLAVLGDIKIRDDKVMPESERNRFLDNEMVVEEKIDGANLGISFDGNGNIRIQNRGSYLVLPASGQWKKLSDWLDPKIDSLFETLTDRFILFGEWCHAQHSVSYDRLPDWFLGYDIFDKKYQKFLSCLNRDRFFERLDISQAPVLAQGHFSFSELKQFLSHSRFGKDPAEGVYLRIDQGEWLAQRAKLVQPAFIQSMGEHWSRSGLKTNRLESDVLV